MLNGYERRTQQKKELILQTAIEMFFRNGIANTSVSDIAQGAKVSKVTIFKYFESKEKLVREAMNIYFNNYLESELKILKSEEHVLKKMEMLFSFIKGSNPMTGNDVLSSEVWKDPLMQQIYSELTAKAMPDIIGCFEQGKAEGLIDSSIPNEALLAYISLWASLANPGTHEVSREYVLGIAKLFYFGLFGEKDNYDDRKRLFKSYEQSII